MRTVKISKVTLNIGAGTNLDDVKKAVKLLNVISKHKVVTTVGTKRIPEWGVRPNIPLGAKVTVRKGAKELLKRLLVPLENKLKASQFTQNGVSFGVKEYIDIPDVAYDPKMGIMGLDVCVTLERAGARVSKRKILRKKLSIKQHISKEEGIEFMKSKFGVTVE